jgi:hypothetical protein
MRPTTVGEWQRLNEELYDLCDRVQQQLNDTDDADAYATFVSAASELSFFLKRIERDFGGM